MKKKKANKKKNATFQRLKISILPGSWRWFAVVAVAVAVVISLFLHVLSKQGNDVDGDNSYCDNMCWTA